MPYPYHFNLTALLLKSANIFFNESPALMCHLAYIFKSVFKTSKYLIHNIDKTILFTLLIEKHGRLPIFRFHKSSIKNLSLNDPFIILAKVLKQVTKYIYCCPQGQTFSSRAQAACIIFLSLALQPQTNQQIVHQYLHKLPSGFNFFLQAAKYFFYLQSCPYTSNLDSFALRSSNIAKHRIFYGIYLV